MEKARPAEKEEILVELVGFHPKRLWNTIKGLLTKPAQVTNDYCIGERKSYLSPIAYFILTYGLAYLILELSGHLGSDGSIAELTKGFENAFKSNPKLHDAFIKAFYIVFSKNVFLFVYIPSVMTSWWFLFRKHKKSFIHHVYFILYIAAQINLFTLPVNSLYFWMENDSTLVTWLSNIISSIYTIYAAKQFYDISYTQTIIKVLLGQFVLLYLPMALFLFGTHAVVTLIIYMFS